MSKLFNAIDNPKLTTPWKIQSSILNLELPSKAQAASINGWFFSRWLSGNRHTIPIAAILNRYYNMPPEICYVFANDYAELTDMRNKVSFIAVTKEKRDSTYQKLLDNIQRRYKISEEQSEEYFLLMSDDERDRMFSLYDCGLQK
jgi:hypothetical protein